MQDNTHLRRRCAQRNIRPADLDLVLTYGVPARDAHGCRVLPPRRYDLRTLEEEGLPERQLRRIRNLLLITDRDGGLVTAYHPRRGKLTRSSRLVRNAGKGA